MIVPDLTRLSPNFNRNPDGTPAGMPPSCKTVIVHSTRSGTSMNPTEYTGTLNYMATEGTTSSHLVIGRKANQIARVVPDEREAWHAGVDNDNAWGIELEQGVEADGFTDVQLAQLVEAGKHYVSLGVPVRHSSTSGDGGFVGHQETAQGRSNGKSDPGNLFPWEWFMAQLQPAPPVPGRVWAYGNEANGLELRDRQQVTWIGGVEVYSIGDPEGEGVGRIAKNFGGSWKWLRLGRAHEGGFRDAVWHETEGD